MGSYLRSCLQRIFEFVPSELKMVDETQTYYQVKAISLYILRGLFAEKYFLDTSGAGLGIYLPEENQTN
jgi:hypothetical protein